MAVSALLRAGQNRNLFFEKNWLFRFAVWYSEGVRGYHKSESPLHIVNVEHKGMISWAKTGSVRPQKVHGFSCKK